MWTTAEAQERILTNKLNNLIVIHSCCVLLKIYFNNPDLQNKYTNFLGN